MSCRHLLAHVVPAIDGAENAIELFRDCESRSYRLFIGSTCADLTFEELRRLSMRFTESVVKHSTWVDDDGNPTSGKGETI